MTFSKFVFLQTRYVISVVLLIQPTYFLPERDSINE